MTSSTSQPRNPRRTADQWQKLIHEFEQGQLTAKQFCQHHQVGPGPLAKWRHRFGQISRSANFVQIPSPPSPASVSSVSSSTFHVRLDLGSGIVLELSQI